MRCLGRLVLLVILVLLLGAAWLYRDEVTRWGRGIVDPMSVVRRTGTPSPEALSSAQTKVVALTRAGGDSVLLNASELASLIVSGSSLLGVDGLDSIAVELGDRSIRVRSMVATAKLPERYRRLIPGTPSDFEEVIVVGDLTPARPGVAEWRFDRVMVRGLPLPADLVARVVGQATGTASDGRLEIALPPDVAGFRVRPEGVAIYRSAQ
ncbi:MAG: hypothetical protein SFU57_04845 [Gemmatimonadales bacterium]|nr:hypothetical protein [Gemmatimonadales bacterium]